MKFKFKTIVVAAAAGGIGYVLGTKAGRARFEQLRGQAQDFIKSPTVQDTVANLSDTVKQSAGKLPDPVASVVTAAADKVKDSTSKTSTGSEPTGTDFTGPDSTVPDFTGSESTVSDFTAPESTVSEPTGTDFTSTDPTTPTTPPRTSQQ